MIIWKFITWLRDNTIIAQEQIDSSIEIIKDLDAFGYAEFTMPIIPWIQEDTVVELYDVNINDTLLFRGYIHQITPIRQQFGQMEVVLRAEKAVFYRRLVLAEKNYSWTDIKDVLENLVAVYNSSYDENWTVETDFTKNITLELNIWDDLYDVFDELAEQCQAKWIVDKGKIEFKREIGIDRTSWGNYQEVVYNHTSPSNANIAKIDVTGIAQRANIVVTKDKDWNTNIDDSAYTAPLYWVAYENLRTGDLADKTAKKLENINKLQRKYQVQVEENAIVANIGDRIQLTVENTNSFFDFDGTVYVKKKIINIDNGSANTEYELEELNTTPIGAVSFLRGIKKKLRLLQI